MLKKFLNNILSKKTAHQAPTWVTENSIFNFIASNIDKNGQLSENDQILPDECRKKNEVHFAPGLEDVLFEETRSDTVKDLLNQLNTYIKQIALTGEQASEQAFYDAINAQKNIVKVVDPLIESIIKERLPTHPYLFDFASNLAKKSNHRNAVKLGIAILGICKKKSALAPIKILGLHDEFTLYCAVAIMNLSDTPENDLWQLAQKVNGWGRIQTVEKLTELELSEPVKNWLILDGYKNNILYEHLAYTCAVHGSLHKNLEQEKIANNLFKSASEILDALIVDYTPAEDIHSYSFSHQLIPLFLTHAKKQQLDVSDFIVLHKVKDHLTAELNNFEEHNDSIWSEDLLSNCIIEAADILQNCNWEAQTIAGLQSHDKTVYWNAKQAAEKLGIDLWETVWLRLKENPDNSMSWYDVTRNAKPEHVEKIIHFALTNLPFEQLATGAEDCAGFGSEYIKHTILEYVVSFLKNYPQQGEKIILTALRSPVVRTRNVTIYTLEQWGRELWSTEIEAELKHLQAIEPNKTTQENLEKLLQ